MKLEIKNFRKKFVVIFSSVIFIVAVLLVANIDYKGKVSKENRYLATFPKIDNGSDIAKFPNGFEDWLNDRFGYRSLLIKRYRKFLYNVFNELAPNSKLAEYQGLALGERGYIFHPGFEKSINLNGVMDDYPATAGPIIDEAIDIIEKFGLKAIILDIPMPELFVFEKLPSYIKVDTDEKYVNEPIAFKIPEYMKEKNRDKYIVPFKEMKTLDNMVKIYPSANFHQVQKSPGTYLLASIVAERFNKGVLEYPNLADFTTLCEKNSDLSQLVGLTIKNNPFYCSSNNYKDQYGVQVLDIEDPFANITMVIDSASDNFSTKYIKSELPITYLMNENKVGKLLVIGSSFSVPILPDLGKYFGEVLRLHRDSVNIKSDQFYNVVKAYKPEYILFVGILPSDATVVADVLSSIHKK